jgi:FixJ family two-component response regulator
MHPQAQRAEEFRELLATVCLEMVHFDDPRVFLRDWKPKPPECLVLDVRLPGMSGLDLQERIHEREGAPLILFCSEYGTIPEVVRAMKQGAWDFLQQSCSPQRLLDAVLSALEESARQNARSARVMEARESVARLTTRQRQILQGVVRGLPSRQIADELGIKKKTVDVHRSEILRRTNAGSVAELVRIFFLAEEGSPFQLAE